jgi:protein phosphatase
VSELTNENGRPLNAGTTLACVAIIDNDLYWASVGDSRIYIVRGDEMVQVTEDHNYGMILSQKVKQGLLTEDEANSHPKREALISYIGMNGVRHIDLNSKPFRLWDGDHILICSDGFYRCVEDAETLSVIRDFSADMTEAAEALTSLALSKHKKNQDNTTVILIGYMDSG